MLYFNGWNPHGKKIKLLNQSKFSSLNGREYQCVSYILKGVFNFFKNITKKFIHLELHALQFLYMYVWGLSCQLLWLSIVNEWSFIVSGFEEEGKKWAGMLTSLCLGSDFLSIGCQWPL